MQAIGSSIANAPNSYGFTLIELLAVIGILSVMIVLLAPAAATIQRGTTITQAGNLIEGKLNYARQAALTLNQPVEVRFYTTTLSQTGTTPVCTAFQLFSYTDAGTSASPLDKVYTLPDGVLITTVPGYSTLLDAPSRSGTTRISSMGNANYPYKGFRFNPNGTTDLDLNGPGGLGNDTWFVTLSAAIDPATAKTPPKNFFTIQVDPLNGALVTFRP